MEDRAGFGCGAGDGQEVCRALQQTGTRSLESHWGLAERRTSDSDTLARKSSSSRLRTHGEESWLPQTFVGGLTRKAFSIPRLDMLASVAGFTQ